MIKHHETIQWIIKLCLISILILLVFITIWKSENNREVYVDKQGEKASQIARNSVTAQRYLPAIIQWHMENQTGIGTGYFEKGTLDYDCNEQGWKLKHMVCSVSGIGYTLAYTPQGRIMRFEWDYTKGAA